MSKTQQFKKVVGLEKVPDEKWPTMVKRTILGGLFICLGLIGLNSGWEVYWVVGACVFGASFWSTQLVTSTLMALLNPLKAARRAWKDDDA